MEIDEPQKGSETLEPGLHLIQPLQAEAVSQGLVAAIGSKARHCFFDHNYAYRSAAFMRDMVQAPEQTADQNRCR